jgi:HSP20 family protein
MAEAATKLPIKTDSRTALAATSPRWTPFDSLRREIDRAFDNFGLGSWRLPAMRSNFDLDLFEPKETTFGLAPAVDVTEKEKEFEITAELPGLDEKDIEVKVASGALTIKGEKKEHKEDRKEGYYLSERRYGSFLRSFGLPDGVDTDKIEASFAKGVLTVKLPKTQEAQKNAKKIEVKAA